jgi:predicted CXXCH cytochrome family protein
MKSLFLAMVIIIIGNALSFKRLEVGIHWRNQEPECLDCHQDLINRKVVHPVAEDACDNCHLSNGKPHPGEGSREFTLMDSLPDLCFYCHTDPGPYGYGHAPVKEHDCLACHDVHGSSEFRLLKASEVELCISCHGETEDAQHPGSNIKRLISGDQVVHSAISSGGCIACHLPHGSNIRAMLVAPYPEENYLPAVTENFELCFLCHDTDLLLAEETAWGTNFRSGTKNLHWVHCQGNKGRNCRMCHNLHGSPLPFLIEERVMFGAWEMNMQFKQEENGGSCLPGCHAQLSYERE